MSLPDNKRKLIVDSVAEYDKEFHILIVSGCDFRTSRIEFVVEKDPKKKQYKYIYLSEFKINGREQLSGRVWLEIFTTTPYLGIITDPILKNSTIELVFESEEKVRIKGYISEHNAYA